MTFRDASSNHALSEIEEWAASPIESAKDAADIAAIYKATPPQEWVKHDVRATVILPADPVEPDQNRNK
jgi:hypothetical protein